MRIGYQGITNCYSYKVCESFLSNYEFIGFKSFDLVFKSLSFGLVDYAVIPIENSIGGCIFMNYDNFYKYDIKIHCEFHYDVNHSLYCKKTSNITKLKKVISHPQAIQQCKENIKNADLEIEEFWDTTASLEKLKEFDDEYACIGPPNLAQKYELIELCKNFNDQKNNITRFYLISLKNLKKPINLLNDYELNGNLENDDTNFSNDNFILNNRSISLKIKKIKFSGYAIFKDEIGCLCNYLQVFRNRNINLTKIESRPYLGIDRSTFSYIFFIEGEYCKTNDNSNNFFLMDSELQEINNDLNYDENFVYFGNFPLVLKKENDCLESTKLIDDIGCKDSTALNLKIELIKSNSYESVESISVSNKKIGIVGFGRFGEFIGKRLVNYGFDVVTTSRNDYTNESNEIGIKYLKFDDFIKEDINIIIFSVSINSFKNVVNKFPIDFFKDKLIVDVLSVKEFPQEILTDLFKNNPILLTHPMFGPDSGKDSWYDKRFVYWFENDDLHNENTNIFLKFWKDQGCRLINLDPKIHDELSANSQFLSHLVGRILDLLHSERSLIDTDLYKNLINVRDYSINDSWDLFYGLYKYNKKSRITLLKFKYCFEKLLMRLKENTEISNSVESDTNRLFREIKELEKKGEKIFNLGIGVPTWYPNNILKLSNKNNIDFEYSTSKGNDSLIDTIIELYNKNNLLEKDVELKNENIIITPGAKPALYLILKELTKSGSNWVIPKPYWVSYPDIIYSLGGDCIFIDSEIENNWCPDYYVLFNTIKESMANDLFVNGIILCNPNNPTGLVYPKEFVKKLINLITEMKIFLIIDEVYLMLVDGLKSLFCNNPYIIVFSSFSKYYAMPGLRVGYIMASSELINKFCKVQSLVFSCTSSVSQQICENILKSDFNPDLKNLLISEKKISDLLVKKGWEIANLKKNSKNYTKMYVFAKSKNGKDFCYQETTKLFQNKVAVISGESFGYDDCIRITMINSSDDLCKILDILENTLVYH